MQACHSRLLCLQALITFRIARTFLMRFHECETRAHGLKLATLNTSVHCTHLKICLTTSCPVGKFDSETAFAAAGAVSVSASKANGISTSASGSISKAGR